MAQLERIYDALIDAHITRQDFVVALGGGVVGDIAGYAACTSARGALHSDADDPSGAGGFLRRRQGGGQPPARQKPARRVLSAGLVMIDCDTLKTLDTRQIGAGLGESSNTAASRTRRC